TWTFDPLVRRNAWFNIEVLHADVAEYLVNFYGPMSDAVNRQDETDRLLMAWRVDSGAGSGAGSRVDSGVDPGLDAEIEVDTPADIVKLRRTDPGTAMEWRLRVRSELGDRLAAGARVIGFTREGAYRVVSTGGVG
ncbi:MAG: hypothetical protein WD225_05010, partial [Ilumatobacteraceae bacterium]